MTRAKECKLFTCSVITYYAFVRGSEEERRTEGPADSGSVSDQDSVSSAYLAM